MRLPGLADLGLVLGVAHDGPQLGLAVRNLRPVLVQALLSVAYRVVQAAGPRVAVQVLALEDNFFSTASTNAFY